MSDLVLTELVVSGFKTLVEDVRIPLAPGITVLVGANNSGKSNVLRALQFLGVLMRSNSVGEAITNSGGPARVVSRGGAGHLAMSVEASAKGLKVSYEFDTRTNEERSEGMDEKVVTRDANGGASYDGQRLLGSWPSPLLSHFATDGRSELRQHLLTAQTCELFVPSLRREALLDSRPILGPDGLNIAAVLDVLRDTQPQEFERLVDEVRRSAPEIKQLVFPPGNQPGTKVLGVHETNGQVFSASEISDGVLLLIGLTTVAQLGLGAPPKLLALEEPDRGIHPRRIRDVVDQLRRVAARGCQVVITTHSPILLDEFRDEPESILLLDRDERGTRVSRLSDHPDVEDMLRGRSLGDLWYSGLLGGVPARSTGAG